MSEARRWIEQARRDLCDAEYAAAGSPWNLACFLAQPSAEKASKAYLDARGAEAVCGHSVAELCSEAGGHDRAFDELWKEVAALDRYDIPTRSPNGLPGGIPADAYGQIVAERALGLTRRVIDLVAAKLSAAKNERCGPPHPQGAP